MVIEIVSNEGSRLTGLHMIMAISLLQMNLTTVYTKFVSLSQNIIMASFLVYSCYSSEFVLQACYRFMLSGHSLMINCHLDDTS